MWYGIRINSLAIAFVQFLPETPWDVMNEETGEIRMFSSYEEAYGFAKEVGLP